MEAATKTKEQTVLFDIGGREIDALWVDASKPLMIPNNPTHWKAHKLQLLLDRLILQCEKYPSQFSPTFYLRVLDEFTALVNKIKAEEDTTNGEVLDAGGVAEIGDGRTETPDGDIEPISMDA